MVTLPVSVKDVQSPTSYRAGFRLRLGEGQYRSVTAMCHMCLFVMVRI